MAARRKNHRKTPSFLPFNSLKFLGFAILITLLITSIMLITADKELLSVFELPSKLSNLQVLTPLHLFFLLNVLIISIILMTYLRGEAPDRQGVAPQSATTSRSLLSTGSSLDYEVVQRLRGDYAENQGQHGAAGKDVPEMVALADSRCRSDCEQNESKEFPLNPARSDQQYKFGPDPAGSGHQQQGSFALNLSDESNYTDNNPKAINEVISKEHMISDNEAALSSEQGSSTPNPERPLASTHFTHKKPTSWVHASKSPLKISRPSMRKGDTLDATWKAICDDKSKRSSPFRHHVPSRSRKGDCHAIVDKVEVTCKNKESHMSPSRQKHRVLTRSTSNLMRRRELSIPRDELNAKVESFIFNFHQQIKIQREKSLLGYNQMVDRGAN